MLIMKNNRSVCMNHKYQKVLFLVSYRSVVLGLLLRCGSYSYANDTQQSVDAMIELLSDPASTNFQITITEDDLSTVLDIADIQGAATLIMLILS